MFQRLKMLKLKVPTIQTSYCSKFLRLKVPSVSQSLQLRVPTHKVPRHKVPTGAKLLQMQTSYCFKVRTVEKFLLSYVPYSQSS
jgi:hypothetical protein